MFRKPLMQACGMLSVCLALLALPGRWATAEIQVLPDDSPLKIRGRVGDDSTFVKRLGLIATVAVPELIFRSTDLIRTDGKEQIGRQQVALTSAAKVDLPENTPKDLELKVTGAKFPGTYKGVLYFIQPGQRLNAAVTVPIEVTVEGVPKLTQRKGSEAVKVQLVDCSSSLGCLIARLFQPSAFLSTYPLAFDNASADSFELTAIVNAIGDTTHGPLGNVLSVQSPVQVPTQPVFTLPIIIQDAKPLPDHYVGDVQLKTGTDGIVKIPLEVNIRTGPIVPMIVLFVGVLLGRLLKYMKDKGGPQSDLLLNVYRLEGRIGVAPADQQVLQPMLEGVKAQIYDMQLDVARKELGAIENRWALLGTLRSLERTLEPRSGDAGVQKILNDIEGARSLIANKLDQQASTLVTEIEAAVQKLTSPARTGVGAFALATAQAETARVVAARTAQSIPGSKPPPPYVQALSFLTGISGAFRAEVTLWTIRPIIYLLLIGALILLGLQQLYLKNATFGSDPLSDYLGVLVWAMSSDVASRTLTSLRSGS
jgi:hypothetical protein